MKIDSDPNLGGRTAIITGGGSGIGRAIVLRFARAGARVAVIDVAKDAATAVAAEAESLGAAAMGVVCDVSRQTEVMQAFQDVHSRLGPVDVLVNSAGVAHIGNVEQTTEEDLDRLYAVNVKGVYNCLKAAVATMKLRGGVILNI